VKIRADFDRCESNAMCAALAPEYFEVDDDDYLQILKEDVSEADKAQVRQAVAACPMSALSLEE
jgi:ferredoxin